MTVRFFQKYEPYGVFTEDESREEALRRSSDSAFWAVCLTAELP